MPGILFFHFPLSNMIKKMSLKNLLEIKDLDHSFPYF